ncbi:MAG: flagellar filament capping protein FliD [Methylococcales bacterium]|nr:flagellar filament capping protein FliD [Methylococcales bacterium]MBT7443349.1 flagellar filament capping protein FliD [Methylococcales bacterium]
MATITASGIGSGLDVENIVSKLVALEEIPLKKLQSDQSILKAQLSAFGQLKSNISTFETAADALGSTDKFKVFSASSSDSTAFTATADSTSAIASLDVTVTQLATPGKFVADAVTSTDTFGGGDLTIDVGGSSFTVTTTTTDTITDIQSAINSASDNTGVTASVLVEDSGTRLILTSNSTGTANEITITDGLATSLNLTQSAANQAKDSIIDVDGFTVTQSSNTVTGAIQGVTLNLLTEGGSSTLTVAKDEASITSSVNSFISAFNTLRTQLVSFRSEGAQLEADNTVLTMQNQFDSIINTEASLSGVSFSTFAEIGITRNKAGDFELDSDIFSTALSTDFDGISQLFADTDEGFISRLEAAATSFSSFDGLIDAREDGLNARIKDNQSSQDGLTRRLEIVERRIRAQFTALDSLVGSLQSTGSFLSQQLSSIPTPG